MLPEPKGNQAILCAENLRLTRPHRSNAQPFDLRVEKLQVNKGEILALCGPSGCGKSTLLRILAGIERPHTGRVTLVGNQSIDLLSCTPVLWRATRSRLGMVHQDPTEYLNNRRMTVDIVADPLVVHGIDGDDVASSKGSLARIVQAIPTVGRSRKQRAKALAMLDRVGISKEQAWRTPARLSGGQRQRVAIARALITAPEILYLDEPTSALDVSVQAAVMALLSQLRVECELTMVMVTHDLGVVRQYADRVIMMESGRFIEAGSPQALFQAPGSQLTRSMVEASRLVKCAIDPIEQ